MAKLRTKSQHVKRLAKSVQASQTHARDDGTRKDSARPKLGGHARRDVEDEYETSEVARLVGLLRMEKIRFQIIGMTAAMAQNVEGSTFDLDIWIDLPARQYMRVINVVRTM